MKKWSFVLAVMLLASAFCGTMGVGNAQNSSEIFDIHMIFERYFDVTPNGTVCLGNQSFTFTNLTCNATYALIDPDLLYISQTNSNEYGTASFDSISIQKYGTWGIVDITPTLAIKVVKTPKTPTGPSDLTIYQSGTYESIIGVSSPDATTGSIDIVKYCFNWDDGTSSWTDYMLSINWPMVAPEGKAVMSHSWSSEDYYYVRVKAQNLAGLESDWSGSKVVHVYPHKYALLIVGGASKSENNARYWNDLCFMYDILKNDYGYSDSNIYAVYADGNKPSSSNCPDPQNAVSHTNVIDYSATTSNLQTIFSTLDNKMYSKDFLFVWTNDHGSTSSGHSYLNLWGSSIMDSTFAGTSYVGNIYYYDRMVFVMKQCYSGGFIDDLSNSKRVIMTSCTSTQVSYPCDTEGYYGEFTYHFQSAIHWRTPSGTYVDADTNNDNKVSMQEAFVYARDHDSTSETPQINDPGNKASTTYL
jgi:hypothetical protein